MSACCFCFRTKANPPVAENTFDLRSDAKMKHSERKIEEDLHLETYMSDYLNDKNGGGGKDINNQGRRKNHHDTLNVELSDNNTKMYLMQSESGMIGDHRDKS
jgi:hypothetical protein